MSGLSNSEIAQEMTAIEKAWDAIPELPKLVQKDTVGDKESGNCISDKTYGILTITAVIIAVFIAPFFLSLAAQKGSPVPLPVLLCGAGFVGLFMLWSLAWIIEGKEYFGILQTRVLQRKKYQQIDQKEWLEYEVELRKYNKQQGKLAKKKKTIEAQAQKIADEFNIGSLEKKLRFAEGRFSAEEVVAKEEPMDKNLTLLNSIKG